MEDTDNSLSEDLLSDWAEPDCQARLPSDYPWWSEVAVTLGELAQCRTSEAIQGNINKLVVITGSSDGSYNTLSHFLDSVCGQEERELLCSLIIPTLATLALQINKLKPFTGLQAFKPGDSDCRVLHPDFVISIISHSFLSTTGRQSLNLNLNCLDPNSPETHWKLRCYFSYFHSVFQDPGSRGNLIVLKQVSQAETFNPDGLKDQKLINFVIADDIQSEKVNCFRLTFVEDFAKGLVTASNPLNSEFTLKRPELLMPFLLVEDLQNKESLQASSSSSDYGSLSVVKMPKISRNERSLTLTLETLLVGIKQDSGSWTKKSLLRRPSVSAVTSCSDSFHRSISESSPDNLTDSELSENIQARGKAGEVKRNKTKKKESFNERLKAALQRGNTPDESDDQSAALRLPVKPVLPLHRRLIRRQRSSGFKAFTDLDDSEEFFTATEDERSHTPARRCGPLRVAANPVVGRRVVISPTKEPVRTVSHNSSSHSPSPSTCSSNLASDSESFSSDGLGIPKMEDDCLEDLCDKLHGCLETAEDGLQFRNMELRRAAGSLGVRSLSETFLTTISDLDQLGGRDPSLAVVLSHSYSSPNIFSQTETREPAQTDRQLSALLTHGTGQQEQLWVQQMWPVLLWLSASSTPHYQTLKFNTFGNSNLQDLPDITQLIMQKNISVAALYGIIVEFLNIEEDNFFTFLSNKLVSI